MLLDAFTPFAEVEIDNYTLIEFIHTGLTFFFVVRLELMIQLFDSY